MYEQGKAHLQDMLDIRAIRPSHSPWTCPVVLVRKRDSKLCFCKDLWKFNGRAVKHSYHIPRIEEMLDCSHGAVWFT